MLKSGVFSLKGLSWEEASSLAKRAKKVAEHLKEDSPSILLALENGVVDESYLSNTGEQVSSFSGEAKIVMKNGSMWLATGLPGCPSTQGSISFELEKDA